MAKIIHFESSDLVPYPVEVVGESRYRDNIAGLFKHIGPDGVDEEDLTASLVLEDKNPHDANAVRVDVRGVTVGYLSRETAIAYRRKLKARGEEDAIGECTASINGGFRKKDGSQADFGVRLDFDLEEVVFEGDQPMKVMPRARPVNTPTMVGKKKRTSAQIVLSVLGGVVGCGCLGFWVLWVIAKLSGY